MLKLNSLQLEPKRKKYEITFVENVFTTELSALPAKNTNDAKKQIKFKEELEKRKEVFFKSDFIQNFPIVIIFASDSKYIETYPGEVQNLFNVNFVREEIIEKHKLWLHSSKNEGKPKLLIHTRQLTNSISTGLIESLAKIIAKFINENEIVL